MSEQWDTVVIGGGVAGLSAALTLGRARRRVVVLDAGEPRNRFAAHMRAALGNEGVDPALVLQRGREEASAYDVTIRPGIVEQAKDTDDGLDIILADGEVISARTLVVASGLTDELPDIPGLTDQWGAGVLHCPYCHGWEVRDQRLGLLGTSPISLHQAELIRQWSNRLTFFTAGCGPLDPAFADRLRSRDVELIDVEVIEILTADGQLVAAKLADNSRVELDAVFIAPVARPNDTFLTGLQLERADNPMGSFIAVDPLSGRTSHPRIWAIGNVVNPAANVPISIGSGSTAGIALNMALVTEDFDRAVSHAGRSSGKEESAERHWESQYADRPRRWSGRANPTMASVVDALPVGPDSTALELGCGEGGDAIWLAKHGWHVTAVDISATAVARAAESAHAEGVNDSITWISHDLATWTTTQAFDLVTASFFHSGVDLPRTEILRRAAGQLRPGGHLLIVSHVFETEDDVPPWSRRWLAEQGEDYRRLQETLLTPAQEIAELALDEAAWETVIHTISSREATGPDGHETATIKDGIVLLRRRSTHG